jgi:hypothetical protein
LLHISALIPFYFSLEYLSSYNDSYHIFFPNFLSISVKTKSNRIIGSQNNDGQNEDLELPFLDLSTIASATDNFAMNNKLGEGGFGPVYKVN